MSQHAGRTRQHTFAQMLIGQYPFATYIYGLQCVVCTVLYIVHDLHINIVYVYVQLSKLHHQQLICRGIVVLPS